MSDLLGGSRYLRRFLDPTAPRLNLSRKIKTPNDIQQLEQFLRSNKNITELVICELGSNEADIAVLRCIATLLQNNSTSVKKLDLSGISTDETKRFGAVGAIIIAESLERNNTVTELNISGNLIGLEGAKAISKALGDNISLISIDISTNDIGTEGVQSIALALQKNSSLLNLNIAGNPFNTEGAKLMAEISLQSNALIKFDLDKLSQSESTAIARQNLAKEQLLNYIPKQIPSEVYAGYCQSIFMKDATTQFSLQEKLLRWVNSKEDLIVANMFTQENPRASGLIADVGALLLFAWFEGGFNEVRCPTSVLLYRPGHLAMKLLLQNMDRPYIVLSPADFHPSNKGVDPQALFNLAKIIHEKENLQVSMIIEDVEKMFIKYDDPKQQNNIKEFLRLMTECTTAPGSILILGTSNQDLGSAKEKKFDRIVLPKISSTLMTHYMLLLLLQNYEHNLTTNDIKIVAERLAGCKRGLNGGVRKSMGFMFKSHDNLTAADIEELISDAFIISKAKEATVLTMADIDLALRDSNQTIVQGPPVTIETKILTKSEMETHLKLFQAKMLKEKNIFFTFDILSLGMTALKIDQVLHYEFMKKLKKLNLNTTSTSTTIPCLNLIIVEQYWRIDLACHMSRSQFASAMNNKFVTAQSVSILRWNNMESKIMQYEQENVTLKHQLDSVLKNVMRNVVNSQSGIPFEQVTISKTRLGEGGFSEVWKGTWLGQHVALKKMRAGCSPFHMNVFREEAETLTRLRHKHIVMSMGITVDPNTREVVLVMEYLKHGALDDYVRKKGPLSPKQQAQIALDVAKGLLYIHSRTPKVIHRDIKPGNILLYENGKRAKIADFGTARELESSANTVFGTHFYTAPEILLENSYDETCDIYSFGVVLFEMATGTPGLSLKSEGDRVKKINENVKDVKLRQLIIDCVRQDPKKRKTIGQCVEVIKAMRKQLNSASTNTQ